MRCEIDIIETVREYNSDFVANPSLTVLVSSSNSFFAHTFFILAMHLPWMLSEILMSNLSIVCYNLNHFRGIKNAFYAFK